MAVQGTCDPRFAAVREEFERNFAERDEVGASVAVTVGGATVVDLWGGVADPSSGAPWTEDTIGVVWSCTKGATALCAHILASRGELDIEAPVTSYWPEFAKNGKDHITVRMLLSHQAGLAGIREPLAQRGLCDWDTVVDLLAAQEPLWAPGTGHGYHGLTFGHLVGEVVHRIDGRSLGTFFRDEVAAPLGLDFWIGLPEEHEGRVAPQIPAPPQGPNDPLSSFMQNIFMTPESPAGLLFFNSGGFFTPGEIDARDYHAAEIPAVNGITNARGLAGMYRPLANGGGIDGVRLVDEESVVRMGAVTSASRDVVLGVPTRWALGFGKTVDNRSLPPGDDAAIIMSEEAFGHSGMGGSMGFADPRANLSFGYTMNRMGGATGLDARAQSLIDETYRALGYRQAFGGTWYA